MLVLAGEPGIGKSALLDEAAARANGMPILRARGIQSEAQIPFASLLELLRPALRLIDHIPPPQAEALGNALALRRGPAQERFAVGAATLSLLAAYAEAGPVVVLVDDAQWIDDSSAQALLFAFRRLVADPLAVLIAVRETEPSFLDGADLQSLRLRGLTSAEAATLLAGVPPPLSSRLHRATAGNPLALLELAAEEPDVTLAPEDAPLRISTRIARAFVTRVHTLSEPARRALVLTATSDRGDLAMLGRAAAQLGVDLSALAEAESAGLVTLRADTVEFRHPLARSGTYADAPPEQRRAAHRALAATLPDLDVDRRAWHLASAAIGLDDSASDALEQAGARSRERSAYATAMAAFDRAARLADGAERRARLLLEAARAAWLAGLAERAVALADEARAITTDVALRVAVDQLAGHIATRRGPVMHGHAILVAAAEHAPAEQAAEMLAEAAGACFYAGDAHEMVAVAARARARLPADASPRASFLTGIVFGMAQILGGDAAAGADAIHAAVALADRSPELRERIELLSWLATAPIFLREAGAERSLFTYALNTARARAAVGALPFVLNLIALDQATADEWAVAESTYGEAMALARESGQRVDLVFSLAGLAGLHARRGREAECRARAAEASTLCRELGTRIQEVWATAALVLLELGLGNAARAAERGEYLVGLLSDLGITDVDVSPAPELVDAYLRLGRTADAERVAGDFMAAAETKGQPWSLARAWRCRGLVSGDVDAFAHALALHEHTPDRFEAARTRLMYGEHLRRARQRVLARDHLRAALETFERLDARAWAERAGAELAATGETLRRRDVTARDALTPQELQIALLLTSGKTTREAAAALFLSPKTIEYHLRHVYQKLGVNSREKLAAALAD